ncbi:D-alanyl-D-alanine carboxypeptidase/D-alanyl-D-alanine endopeptidase [Nocardioides mesophilus]|uniref:D-alanyl-D-alanine carboxypeptidase/D-alanyl-D-alanine-endopeptidase n=1 Tax=Nocardioides mesophilus TaxID=433659 RepID=A0A7G9R6H4_9ACTN|nr:D-alanyl-D-alanine carboxypeptidase/D-alanyl-D-alanine-endopeptidase [Nocardioides mesophilus]QNN51199.1 D-alanyl-D-alanine carboxypeptidase/D-alanyl-D-alanine-endopeptidase [Nocardioides mesophilus]
MSQGDAEPVADDASRPVPASGRRLRRWSTGLVVVLLLAALTTYQFDLGTRWFDLGPPSPVSEPAKVPPPPGLSLPQLGTAPAVAESTAPADADPVAVRRAVAALAASRALGPRVAVDVAQLSDGESVLSQGPAKVTPASTLKLLTAGAALVQLGADHRFTTSVVRSGPRGPIVLVGGGDPFLASQPVDDADVYPPRADVQTLARSTARTLRASGRDRVQLRYDASLFSGPQLSPHWGASYFPDNVVTPISSLWVDEGLQPNGYQRYADPAAAAAEVFADALRERGIKVVGQLRPGRAAPESTELAAVQSAPLGQIVERVLQVSDNEGAEVLARHVALAAGAPATFEGGAAAVLETLGGVGVDVAGNQTFDGSGLSRDDRLRPETLLSLLHVAATSEQHPELRRLLSGLPVAGFTGSLTYRFDTGSPLGLGAVRAKTGTLTGVHGLAGTVTTRDGAVLEFVAIADRVALRDNATAQAIVDRLAAALAACRCAA